MAVLDIAEKLPAGTATPTVKEQMARAALSVGANVEEADGTLTRPDSRKTLVVARKETREARYWLRIVERRWRNSIDVHAAIEEATEILRILSAIIAKLG